MIQRIQTIWLLLASILSFVSLQTSFFSGIKPLPQDAAGQPEPPYAQLTGMSNWLILAVTIVMALLALISIFLYKNRTLQLRVALAGLLCSVGLIFLYYRETRQFLAGQGTLDLTALVVMVIPFLFFLAIRGIYKDEHLVKSVNRLR
ncbi:MAG: DUF4293 domain-containing protein [Bacteroidota bacterium]